MERGTTSAGQSESTSPATAVSALWSQAGLDAAALGRLTLTGAEPALRSSFAIGTAAQASIAAAALAASEVGALRGLARSSIRVDMTHAALECGTYFAIDGRTPEPWDAYSGLYRTGDGWVRIHANFAHHRDGALALLGLRAGPGTTREAVERALLRQHAEAFEAAADERGLVVAAMRSFADWDAHPQGFALSGQPTIAIKRIATEDRNSWAFRRSDPRITVQRPLEGLRVLDLTRVLAGPVAGRALAAYGADVMLVNSPKLPNIEAIADTSRGKRSVHVDLETAEGRRTLRELVAGADVFMEGYRPGSLAARGFGPDEISAIRPGIVIASLSAYGDVGPWAGKRGFDSLVQTATGFNVAEAAAFGVASPGAMPVQILDHATGYLTALAVLAALCRQRNEGGGWRVTTSLARTGAWLRSLGRVPTTVPATQPTEPAAWLTTQASGFGRLSALRHSASFDGIEATWQRPSMPPGSHPPRWDDKGEAPLA